MTAKEADARALTQISKPGPWVLRFDNNGYPLAIVKNGWVMLNLTASQRTVKCAQAIVDILNGQKPKTDDRPQHTRD